MTPDSSYPEIAAGDHRGYMELALSQARLSPPSSSNFCVGAVLVDASENKILSTGYTLELPPGSLGDPGTTHAEQCCFIKVAQEHHVPEEYLHEVLPPTAILYATMEPCNKRLSGSRSCVDRILGLGGAIKTIYIGAIEPETFITNNSGRRRLEDAGIRLENVDGMQDRILEVATSGHSKSAT